MNKVQLFSSDGEKDSSSCSFEMKLAVLIGHPVLLLHIDRVSEDPGSGDGGSQQCSISKTHPELSTRTHTHTHKDFTPNRGQPVNTFKAR